MGNLQKVGPAWQGEIWVEVKPKYDQPATAKLARQALTVGRYQREEYLGDALLGFLVAEELYRRRRDWSEAELTQAREAVVSARALVRAALRIGLERRIITAAGERYRDKALADVMEALVAAAYLEGGAEAARAFVLGVLRPELEGALIGRIHRSPKTILLELVQERWKVQPQYRVVNVQGTRGSPEYTVGVEAGPVHAQGTGRSRRAAEDAAARQALAKLGRQQPHSESLGGA